MGGKESKSFPISPEEAAKRVTDTERRRLQESFRRLTATSSSALLSRPLFLRHVLGDCVPAALGDAIYAACGGGSGGGGGGGGGSNGGTLTSSGGGLNFKEVLTLLVLITRGTREEKMKFIFGLLASDSGFVERDELIRFLREFEPQFDYRDLAVLFEEGDKANLDHFSRWEEGHPHALGLFDWLLWPEGGRLSLVNKEDTPTFYQTLAGVTHLEEQEVVELEKRFWDLTGNSGSGRIDLDIIAPLVSPPLPEVLVKPFFSAFDENQDGHIDFKELSCGLSAACRGPELERQKFCFKIFDADRDGVLNRGEVETMCQCMADIRRQGAARREAAAPSAEGDEVGRLVARLWDSHDPQGKGVLTQEEFLVWTVDNAYPREFSRLLFQLCHVVLGLRPLTRREEGQIVRGWLEREDERAMAVGSTWHLINMDWWTSWHNYVNHQSESSASPRSQHGSSELVSGKRGSRKNPSIDSTLASDADKGVVATSYQQLKENQNPSYGSLGRRSNPPASLDSSNNSSRLPTPLASPYSSRKNSSSNTSLNHAGSPAPPKPGVIDNSGLVQPISYRVSTLTSEGGKLKASPKLVRGRDFELIPQRLWKALVNWYGGSPALPRQVIRNKDGRVDLELNPLSLRLMKHQTVARPVTSAGAAAASVASTGFVGGFSAAAGATAGMTLPSASSAYSSSSSPNTTTRRYHAYQCAFSRRYTVGNVAEFLSQRLHVKHEDMRLWRFKSEADMTLLEDEAADLEDCGFSDDESLLMEVRSRDGTWPEEITSLYKSSSNGDRRSSLLGFGNWNHSVKGVTGLNNLGNTCYMNSSIQCVSNTKIVAEYFNRNCHLHELNRTNPLGMKGHIAKRFGDLVRDMWSSETRTIAPIKLRWTIGKYRPQFAGFQQHDAQELLAFLLDGLHEDLNRVTDKPYVELKDSDGRPDAEVALEAWENHVLRNRSLIVDLFHGQLKSKVTCKVCGHESVRFDPFSMLSLPLPLESSMHLEVIVIRQDGSIPFKYGLTLEIEARFSSIKNHLSMLCKIPPQNLVLVDIIQSQFRSIPAEEQKLKSMNGSCIFAYEFYPLANPAGKGQAQSQVNQTFSDIQRSATSATRKVDGTANGKGASQEVREANQQNQQQSKKTKSSCMNGITFCFKGSKDQPEVKIEMKGGHSETGKSPKDRQENYLAPDSPKSDKDSLLANGYPPHQRSPGTASPNTSQKKNGGGHARKDSSASSVQSHDSQSSHNNNSFPVLPEDIASCQQGVVVALHRKMVPQEVYFLSMEKYRPVLFGLPLIIPCSEESTYQDLYKSVWAQVSRLVSPLPPRDSVHNHATDCDDSLRQEYPFTLKLVQKDGSWCSRCEWHRFCRGCPLPCSNSGFAFASSYLAIDWDQTALHLRYLPTQERAYRADPSVSSSLKAASEPITLDKCLEAFTREEELGADEKYYCSSCRTHQLAIKKLQIWRLPPVLIVQLKRFHYLNGRWIKSHKIVDFPSLSLDLTDYLAAVPAATLQRYKSIKRKERVPNGTIEERSEPPSLDGSVSSESSREAGQRDESSDPSGSLAREVDSIVKKVGGADENDVSTNDDTTSSQYSPGRKRSFHRKRQESTSLQANPVKDDDLQDFHEHRLAGRHPLDIKYNLYSMVCHSGVLGGGHYVSYGRAKSGKWFCHNDSACKEVQESQVDKSTAYMLFYEREGLSAKDYLPPLPSGSESLPDTKDLDEELEADFKKQCVVM